MLAAQLLVELLPMFWPRLVRAHTWAGLAAMGWAEERPPVYDYRSRGRGAPSLC